MENSRGTLVGSEGGFSLVELSVAMFVTALALGIATVGITQNLDNTHLVSSRDNLLWRLRWAQARAYEQDEFAWVNLDKYSPTYQVYQGWSVLGRYTFASGVNYRDGYLQMPTGRVFYGVNGDSHVGGTIRLEDKTEERRTIVLYLTSGLQVEGEMTHDNR